MLGRSAQHCARTLTVATIAVALSTGCAISAMQPLPSNYTVDKSPSCTSSSGSIALDVIWGLVWGIPTVAAFSEDEAGLGLLLGLAAGIHVASAVTGGKWGSKCAKAQKDHEAWLAEQRDLLRQQRRANRILRAKRSRPAPPRKSAATDEPAQAPPAATPAAASPAAPRPTAATPRPTATAPTTPSRRSLRLPTPAPRPTKPRPRNADPWAEFWQEVNR